MGLLAPGTRSVAGGVDAAPEVQAANTIERTATSAQSHGRESRSNSACSDGRPMRSSLGTSCSGHNHSPPGGYSRLRVWKRAWSRGLWLGSTRSGGMISGVAVRGGGSSSGRRAGLGLGSTVPWWWAQSRTRFDRAVGPPSRQGMMWWASLSLAGVAQPGNTQPPSRSSRAARMAGVTRRWVRPDVEHLGGSAEDGGHQVGVAQQAAGGAGIDLVAGAEQPGTPAVGQEFVVGQGDHDPGPVPAMVGCQRFLAVVVHHRQQRVGSSHGGGHVLGVWVEAFKAALGRRGVGVDDLDERFGFGDRQASL